MKRVALVIAGMVFGSSALAAGIDSRAYSCADLHALIAANGFVFISSVVFGDFAVSSGYYCSGGQTVDARTVPTTDNPQCPINYCMSRSTGGGS